MLENKCDLWSLFQSSTRDKSEFSELTFLNHGSENCKDNLEYLFRYIDGITTGIMFGDINKVKKYISGIIKLLPDFKVNCSFDFYNDCKEKYYNTKKDKTVFYNHLSEKNYGLTRDSIPKFSESAIAAIKCAFPDN